MSWVNRLLGSAWRGLSPLYAPIVRKFDTHVNRLVNQALSSELDSRLVPTLTAALECTTRTVERLDALIAHTERSSLETDLALSGLLEELVRLREQVQSLQQVVLPDAGALEPDHVPLDGLAFDEAHATGVPFAAESAEERAQVG